jgi:hypothetical protein
MKTLVDARGGRMGTCSAMIGVGGGCLVMKVEMLFRSVEDRRKLKKGGSA